MGIIENPKKLTSKDEYFINHSKSISYEKNIFNFIIIF